MLIDYEIFLSEYYPETVVEEIKSFYEQLSTSYNAEEFETQWLELIHTLENKHIDEVLNTFTLLVAETVSSLYKEQGIVVKLDNLRHAISTFNVFVNLERLEVDDLIRSIFENDYTAEEQLSEVAAHITNTETEEWMNTFKEVSPMFVVNFIDESTSNLLEDDIEDKRLRWVPLVRNRLKAYLRRGVEATYFVNNVYGGMLLGLPFTDYVNILKSDWSDLDDSLIPNEVFVTALGSALNTKECLDKALLVINELIDDPSLIMEAKVKYEAIVKELIEEEVANA